MYLMFRSQKHMMYSTDYLLQMRRRDATDELLMKQVFLYVSCMTFGGEMKLCSLNDLMR